MKEWNEREETKDTLDMYGEKVAERLLYKEDAENIEDLKDMRELAVNEETEKIKEIEEKKDVVEAEESIVSKEAEEETEELEETDETDEMDEPDETDEIGEADNSEGSKEINITSDISGVRIDAFLSSKIEKYSRTYFQKLIENGMVRVNGKNVKSNYKVKLEDRICVDIPEPQKLDVKAENIDIEVLYEDDDILIVNKPKGMVVHPAAGNYSGTLVNALMAYCGDSLSDINGIIRPGIVHRIDKDTSGVLVVAKNNAAHESLSALLKKHEIKRIYIAVVYGIIREDSGRIEAPIGRHPTERKKMAVNTKNGRKAITHFRVLERFRDCTYIELRLETGRTHQIRVHMSYIGHPLVGDAVYGSKKQKYDVDGQALHAKVLGFVHPRTGEYMEFEADIPEYFKKLLEELRNR